MISAHPSRSPPEEVLPGSSVHPVSSAVLCLRDSDTFLLKEFLTSADLYPNSQVGSNTHKSRILIEAGFHKLLEGLAVVTLKRWRVVFGDQEENPHRMQVRIWGFSLC